MNKVEDKADDGGDGSGGGGKGGKGKGVGEEFHHVNSPFSPPPEQKEESSNKEDAFKTPSPTSNRFVALKIRRRRRRRIQIQIRRRSLDRISIIITRIT